MQMTTAQIKNTKSDLSVWTWWSRWQPSTGKNDSDWFTKNTKCSNMNWLPFISPKRAEYKVYKTKRSSTEWFIWRRSVCMYVHSRFQKRRENEVTHAPNSQSQSQMNEPVFYRNEFQQIKQNQAIFVWMKKNKDFIKVRRKQSYNKHLIRRLTSQYGWVFLRVELYFGSP